MHFMEDQLTVIGVEQTSIVKQKIETPCLSMRPKEAAAALGISERLLWDWTKRNFVPHVRIGGVVVYPTDALRDWLQKQAASRDEEKAERA
jgi:predicted DNA-binding transcriptional regulator AlpA